MTDLGDRKIVADSIASFDIIRRFALHHDLTYRRLMTSDLGPPAMFLDEATSDSRCVNLYFISCRLEKRYFFSNFYSSNVLLLFTYHPRVTYIFCSLFFDCIPGTGTVLKLTSTLVPGMDSLVVLTRPPHQVVVRKRSSSCYMIEKFNMRRYFPCY